MLPGVLVSEGSRKAWRPSSKVQLGALVVKDNDGRPQEDLVMHCLLICGVRRSPWGEQVHGT